LGRDPVAKKFLPRGANPLKSCAGLNYNSREGQTERRIMQRLLEGKKGLILGVANKWSIAWGISMGSYQGDPYLVRYEIEVTTR